MKTIKKTYKAENSREQKAELQKHVTYKVVEHI